jgi:uncharacterized protein (TIGR03435 family)
MKGNDVSVDGTLNRHLRKSGSPSPEQVTASVEKVWEQLRHEAENTPLTDRRAIPRRFRFTVAFAVLVATAAIGLYAAQRGGFLPSILPVQQVLPPQAVLPTAQSPGPSGKAAAETAQVAVVTPEARKLEFAPSREQILAGVAAQIAAAQSTDAGAAGPIQRVAFEVVSIRPYDPTAAPPPGSRGGGGGARGVQPCSSDSPRVVPGRFIVTRATTLRLISWGYGIRNCRSDIGLISGIPEWVNKDQWDIQGTMPAGTPFEGRIRFEAMNAPQLQGMLRTMLEERFKLKWHRATREMDVFNLVVSKPGKMTPSKDQTPPPDPYGERNGIVLTGGVPPPGIMVSMNGLYQGTSIPISGLMSNFQGRSGRPVIDKTGLTGYFDIKVSLSPEPGATPPQPGSGLSSSDFQILDGLGLKLESSRAPVEVFIIDSIEKPSEN